MRKRSKVLIISILSLFLILSSVYIFQLLERDDKEKRYTYNGAGNNLVKKEEVEVSVVKDELVKRKLDVPESIQENSYFCVPATLQMVLSYNGIHVSQSELAKELNTDVKTGTEYEDLARVANKYLFKNEFVKHDEPGYHVQTLNQREMTTTEKQLLEERIVTNFSTNDPTFIAIDNKAMYKNLNRGNHMIVVIGYNVDCQHFFGPLS